MYETIAKANGDVTVNGHAPKMDFEVSGGNDTRQNLAV